MFQNNIKQVNIMMMMIKLIGFIFFSELNFGNLFFY